MSGLSGRLVGPFYTGVTTSNLVPDLFDVALAGHGYMLDRQSKAFDRSSIPYLRPYFLTEGDVNERTLSPDAGWRRSVTSWHHGSNQVHLDYDASDRAMFRTSKGVNVWTQWQLTLLPDVDTIRTSGNGLQLVTAGTYLYVSDGAALQWRNLGDITWTDSGLVGTPLSITSDGHTVYVALAGGVAKTLRGTGSTSLAWSALVASLIRFVSGRLMAAHANVIYNIIDPAGPVTVGTHNNTDFTWVGFAEGQGCIFAAGFSGDRSEVWRIGIASDGATLNPPIPALPGLPAGEIVTCITSYLGFVILGTNLGVRLATQDPSTGNLTLGPRIPTANPVRCVAGFDHFVYFGWENYDTNSTGLGCFDLQVETASLLPAFASDLMATTQGHVSSVVIWGGQRVFCVDGQGVYQQSANLVASGSLQSGLLTFNIPDPKVALYADVRPNQQSLGSVNVGLGTDGGSFVSLGTQGAGVQPVVLSAQATHGDVYEVQLVLKRDSDHTKGPLVQRLTLIALPAAQSGQSIVVPLDLTETVTDGQGNDVGIDVLEERLFLQSLREDKIVFRYQELQDSSLVTLEDYKFVPTSPTRDRSAYQGTFVATLKTLDPPPLA